MAFFIGTPRRLVASSQLLFGTIRAIQYSEVGHGSHRHVYMSLRAQSSGVLGLSAGLLGPSNDPQSWKRGRSPMFQTCPPCQMWNELGGRGLCAFHSMDHAGHAGQPVSRSAGQPVATGLDRCDGRNGSALALEPSKASPFTPCVSTQALEQVGAAGTAVQCVRASSALQCACRNAPPQQLRFWALKLDTGLRSCLLHA